MEDPGCREGRWTSPPPTPTPPPKVTRWDGRSDPGILVSREGTQCCLHVNILHRAGHKRCASRSRGPREAAAAGLSGRPGCGRLRRPHRGSGGPGPGLCLRPREAGPGGGGARAGGWRGGAHARPGPEALRERSGRLTSPGTAPSTPGRCSGTPRAADGRCWTRGRCRAP